MDLSDRSVFGPLLTVDDLIDVLDDADDAARHAIEALAIDVSIIRDTVHAGFCLDGLSREMATRRVVELAGLRAHRCLIAAGIDSDARLSRLVTAGGLLASGPRNLAELATAHGLVERFEMWRQLQTEERDPAYHEPYGHVVDLLAQRLDEYADRLLDPGTLRAWALSRHTLFNDRWRLRREPEDELGQAVSQCHRLLADGADRHLLADLAGAAATEMVADQQRQVLADAVGDADPHELADGWYLRAGWRGPMRHNGGTPLLGLPPSDGPHLVRTVYGHVASDIAGDHASRAGYLLPGWLHAVLSAERFPSTAPPGTSRAQVTTALALWQPEAAHGHPLRNLQGALEAAGAVLG